MDTMQADTEKSFFSWRVYINVSCEVNHCDVKDTPEASVSQVNVNEVDKAFILNWASA